MADGTMNASDGQAGCCVQNFLLSFKSNCMPAEPLPPTFFFFFYSRTRCKTFLIALSFNTVPLAFTCAATSRRTYGVMIITLSSPFFRVVVGCASFFF